MTSCQITIFIATVANMIAEDKTVKELNILSALFVLLGDNLATISILKGGEEALEEVTTNIP
ncbi:DUF6774 domain-containing protein [Aminipila sp.]|uniref:DUF6774 domain-containing protein n=1 Tax=Aminipila sp. TaxID=2060095 RepID=UPI00289CC5EE|nr:DUF6774 domain-containing protein [Aminipila sp.]